METTVNPSQTLQLLFDANQLKLIPRIGWQLRGVRPPESVAEHSFGVAFEEQALAHLLGDLPFGGEYRELWQEFEERSSAEGRLVRDADKLEMMIQALAYERDAGATNLSEFWDQIDEYPFAFEISRTLYQRLREMRHP